MFQHEKPYDCGSWLQEDKKLICGMKGKMLWLMSACLPPLLEEHACSDCEYIATRPFYLKRHKLHKHSGRTFQCDECDYAGSTKITLKMHKDSRFKVIQFPCEQCDYEATGESNLKRHIMTKHKSKKYPCSECEYTCGALGYLKKHMMLEHDITEPETKAELNPKVKPGIY